MLSLPPPVLEVYYAPTCAPCRLDLPIMAELVTRHGVVVHVVIVSDAAKALGELKAISPELAKSARISDKRNPRETLRQAGDPDGILPYARARDQDKTCATWRGRLSLTKALQMLSACRKKPTSPPSR